jgi:hypothetical protein
MGASTPRPPAPASPFTRSSENANRNSVMTPLTRNRVKSQTVAANHWITIAGTPSTSVTPALTWWSRP